MNNNRADMFFWFFGGVLLVVGLSVVVGYFLFGGGSEASVVLAYHEGVCQNLDKVTESGGVVYPAVMHSRDFLFDRGINVRSINGSSGRAYTWDDDGVMCDLDVVGCYPGFCVDMVMVVPVNYTEYEMWRNE